MKRTIEYPGQLLPETDLLNIQRNTMTAIAMLAQAVLGTSTLVDGVACTQTTVPSLQVQVGPGSIYSLANLDATAYSTLPADTTDSIVKQGITLGQTLLTITPPGTVGFSQVFLVQVQLQDVDTNSSTLTYFNAANPQSPWLGPNNTGVSQFTVRDCQCVIALKAGTAAATGSQTTPSADAGWTGLYAITVANGATQVLNTNIATLSTAPFITNKIPQIPNQSGVVGSMRNGKMSVVAASATATFTADEIVVETVTGVSYKPVIFNQTINLAATGVGGMDTGSAPVSGYVALYAIYNPTTAAAALLAVNATSAAQPSIYTGGHMPSGYTASALVSVWATNGSGQFAIGYQMDRYISTQVITVLNNSTTQASPTSLSIASAVPMNAAAVYGHLNASSTGASTLTLSVSASAGSVGFQQNGLTSATAGQSVGGTFARVPIITPQTLFYQAASTAGTPTFAISTSGYEI